MTDHPQVLAGRYEIRELIGRGGMAEVHLGYDKRLSRVIAIKLLRSDIAGDPTFQARFRREAQSAAALNHPAIVAVYDSGEESLSQPDGSLRTVPYIVMEYVEGHTVRELLGDGEAVPIPEAIEITAGVLSALGYSHRAGIIHRDIKPGNIMLSATGTVKVMDFGIARAVEDSSATVTQTHAVVGTAQYLSPEQARGEVVDARSDLYSTGCLLYELLTGQPPFSGDSAVAIAYQHVREVPRPPSSIAADVPEALDRVVLKALAKNRDDRYQDADHMRTDLMAASHGMPVTAPATDTWQATTVLGSPATPASISARPAPAPPSATPATAARREEPERKKKQPWWVWLVAFILLAILGTVLGLAASRSFSSRPAPAVSTPATAVAVPDVTGRSEQEARSAIENAGLLYTKGDDVSSDSVPEGMVVSTDPKTGTSVLLGSTVEVHLSSGSATVEVPDVAGKSQEEARTEIEAVGLEVGTVSVEDSGTVAKDTIIRTTPTAGSRANRGESIDLVVSTGNATVPDLTGLTQAEAREALRNAGLSIGDVTYDVSDSVEEGKVISATHTAGQVVASGTSVGIVVSSGPKPTPSPSPSATVDTATIPEDLVGTTVQDAREKLRRAGFDPSNITIDNEVEGGTVETVSPEPGKTVPKNTKITLTVEPHEPPPPVEGEG